MACSVYGCKNSRETNKDEEPPLRMYNFPNQKWELERKQKWIRFCGRINQDGSEWQPTKNSKICSRHFWNNEKSQHPHNPSYNPTLHPDSCIPHSAAEIKTNPKKRKRSPSSTTEEKLSGRSRKIGNGQGIFSCAVYECKNNPWNTKNFDPPVRFFGFPSYPWEKRRKLKWIMFAKKMNPDGENWEPATGSKICSRHFVGNEKSQDPREFNFNPTLRPSPKEQVLELERRDKVSAGLTGRQESTPERARSGRSKQIKISIKTDPEPAEQQNLVTTTTRGMRLKARMSKPEHESKSPLLPDPVDFDEEDGWNSHDMDVIVDERVQYKKSLEGVLDWIRKKHGNERLPQEVIQLVDPAIREKVGCDASLEDIDDNVDVDASHFLSPPAPETPAEVKLENSDHIADPDSGKMKCTHCSKEFDSAEELSKHSLIHCTVAFFRLPHETRLKDAKKIKIKLHEAPLPVKLKPGEKKKLFKCGVCGVFVKHRATLIAHFKALHAPHKKFYPCVTCNKKFTRASDVRKHVNHVHAKDQECPYCDEWHSKPKMQLHIDRVHFGKRYQCQLCEEKLEHVDLIRSHLYQMHPKETQTTSNNDAVNIIFLGPIKPTAAAKKPTEMPPFKCRRCSEEFPTMYKRRVHVELVHKSSPPREKKYVRKCEICNEEFTSKYQFQLHVDLKHTEGPQSFQCQLCPQVFNRNFNLRRHIKSVHPVNPPIHLCSSCGMTFTRKAGLNTHVARVHNKEGANSFKCENCPAAFAHKQDLKKHEDRHFSRNMKACPICGVLRPANHIKSHVEYVHQGKRFQCKFCDALIHQLGQIRPHLLLKHQEFADSISSRESVNVIYVSPTHGNGMSQQKLKNDIEAKSSAAVDEAAFQTHRSKKNKSASYTCPTCDAIFYCKDAHEVHRIRHERDPEYRLKQRKRVKRLNPEAEAMSDTIIAPNNECPEASGESAPPGEQRDQNQNGQNATLVL